MNGAKKAARAREVKSVALRDAVISGKSHQVAACLTYNGMDVECAGLRGGSPLRLAAEAGNRAIVGLLIEAGADVNRGSGPLQSTALHAACECHRVEVVNQLLAAGADPRQTNADSQTPLHSACYGGSAKIVTTLLGMGAAMANRNYFGATPLSLAAAHGHLRVVSLLLIAGADPNALGTNGDTPLHISSYQGHFDIVVELLLAGAYPSPRHDQTDETPLFIAARAGLVDIVRSLLHADADPAVKTNGWTPLDIATYKVNVPVMREILQHPGVLEGSDMAYNALRLAAAGGCRESVAVLLRAGVNPGLDEPVRVIRQGGFGEKRAHTSRLLCVTTPIEEARRYGHDDIVHQLTRAAVHQGSGASAPRNAGHNLTIPIADCLTQRENTPPDATGVSSSTGGLVSLLKGERRCDEAASDIARKRDPQRRVRFDVPEVRGTEIVQAFGWTPAVAAGVFMEENDVLHTLLPPGAFEMFEGDGVGERRGSVFKKEYGDHNKKAQTLEENIIQWYEHVRTMNEANERLQLLCEESPDSESSRSTTTQDGQAITISTTTGVDDSGREGATVDTYCRVHEEKNDALASTEVPQMKQKEPAPVAVIGKQGVCSDPSICQPPMNVKATSWLGLKSSLLGCFLCSRPVGATGIQRCESSPKGKPETALTCDAATPGTTVV